MRPGAVKIGCEVNHKEVMTTAIQNHDGSVVVALFNPTDEPYHVSIQLDNNTKVITIDAKALQTIIINNK
jgi:glucosylceramidase